MRIETVRNIAIVLGLAAIVAFLPGGGDTSGFITAVLIILMSVALVFFAVRFYREYRIEIHSLGDRHRAILYGSLGAGVLAAAGTHRWLDSGAGTLAWLALVVAASIGLVTVWRHYREHE